jgi:Flp pilus assembly pilin Flp
MWRRFAREQEADDLVEYALLATVVGVAGGLALAAWPGIMNAVYTSWDTGTQDIWEPLDPQ